MCSALSGLDSSFPPIPSREHQDNTEDKAGQNEDPHCTSGERETRENPASKEGIMTQTQGVLVPDSGHRTVCAPGAMSQHQEPCPNTRCRVPTSGVQEQ